MGSSIGELYVTLSGQDNGFLSLTAKAEAAVDKLEEPIAALGAAARAVEPAISSVGAAVAELAPPAQAVAATAPTAARGLDALGAAAASGAVALGKEATQAADLAEWLAAITEATQATATATERMEIRQQKMRGEMRQTSEQAGETNKVLDAMAKLFLTGRTISFLGDSLQSFVEAERVSRRLEQALTQLHGEMGGFEGVLSEYADATERATGVDGDFIQSIQQLLVQMKIAPNEVNRVTQAAIDLAAATGGDAKQAAVLLAKASAENVAELKRWGIEVDEAKVATEGFTAVLSEVERVYGGTANQISDAERAIVANQAAWGDLKEAIGQTVAQLLTFQSGSKSTVSILDGLTELLTQKTTDGVYDYSQRVDELNKARDKEIRLTEAVREAEEELQKLKGSAFYETQKQSLEQLNAALKEAEIQRKRLMGVDVSAVAPTMVFGDEDAIDIVTDKWKRQEEAVKAATEAYERFSRAAEKASDYANAQDTRAASIASQAEDQSFKMAMGVEAAELDANAFIEHMNQEMAKADMALGASTISADARSAAEAWQASLNDAKSAAEQTARAAAVAAEASEAAWESIGSKALGSLGKLGSTISNAMGAAAGGPFAVIASLLLDLATSSEQFKPILEMVSGIFIELANAVGQLLPPLKPLIGSLGVVATSIISALTPILVEVGDVLQQLAPSFMVLGATVAALAPILEVFIKPFLEIQKVIAHALFPVLKTTAIIILTAAKAIGTAWNAIVGGVQWVLHQIGKLPAIGDAADELADSMDGLRVNTDAMGRQIKSIKEMTFDSAMQDASNAADHFGQTTRDAAESADNAAESLDNVPAAWRKNLRVFQAQDGQAGPGGGNGGIVPPKLPNGGAPERPPRPGQETNPVSGSPSAGGSGFLGGGVGQAVNVVMNITGYDIQEAVANAHSLYDRLMGRRGASSTGLSVATNSMKPFGAGA